MLGNEVAVKDLALLTQLREGYNCLRKEPLRVLGKKQDGAVGYLVLARAIPQQQSLLSHEREKRLPSQRCPAELLAIGSQRRQCEIEVQVVDSRSSADTFVKRTPAGICLQGAGAGKSIPADQLFCCLGEQLIKSLDLHEGKV